MDNSETENDIKCSICQVDVQSVKEEIRSVIDVIQWMTSTCSPSSYEVCGPRHEDDSRVEGLLKFSFSGVEEMIHHELNHFKNEVSGLNWWYKHERHAAELTVGYYKLEL